MRKCIYKREEDKGCFDTWLDRSIFRNWWKKEKFNGTASNRFRWPRYSWARNAFEIQTSGGDRRCQLNRGGKRTLNPLRKKLWECVCGITLHFEGAAYGSLAIFPGFNWISYVGISIRTNPLVVDSIALSQTHQRNATKCPLFIFYSIGNIYYVQPQFQTKSYVSNVVYASFFSSNNEITVGSSSSIFFLN